MSAHHHAAVGSQPQSSSFLSFFVFSSSPSSERVDLKWRPTRTMDSEVGVEGQGCRGNANMGTVKAESESVDRVWIERARRRIVGVECLESDFGKYDAWQWQA